MYRLKVVVLHPYAEFEDEVYFDFDTLMEAWNMHAKIFRANNVISVSKPFKVI